jgi:hypothetical protein
VGGPVKQAHLHRSVDTEVSLVNIRISTVIAMVRYVTGKKH